VAFKVLFLGRHGEGWHNVAEAKYGTEAWDVCGIILFFFVVLALPYSTPSPPNPAPSKNQPDQPKQSYYAAQDGVPPLVWSDAHLTPLGATQALAAHHLWAANLPLGLPAPETYYVSPLTRTIQTADLTFSALPLPASHAYAPRIKELAREALGVHTCDRRSRRAEIAAAFPHVAFEEGFAEDDALWRADYREPRSARRYRVARLLDDVFAHDAGVVLSVTSHSGAIKAMLHVMGHREFWLETGGVVPVVVRAERVEGEREVPAWEPSAAPPILDAPPVEDGDGAVAV
jgi:broad specificity phosphatase PhoE